MRFSATVLTAFAAIPVAVSAQNVIKVLVGDQGALAFSPSNVTAQLGDQVAFMFQSKNHTVTQSTFADPCTPATFNGSAGADSGFMFIDPKGDFSQGFPTWTITVNSTAPIWFHCAQTNPSSHCKAGMVFSINATPDKSFDAYLNNAKNSDPSAASSSSVSGGQSSSDPSSSIAGSGGFSSTAAVTGSTSSSTPGVNPASSAPAADQTQGTQNSGAARTGLGVRGLSGVVGAIVLGAVLI